MPKKTVVGEYKGSRIVVENTWFNGAKLFCNGKLVATNNDWFATKKDVPVMSADIFLDEEKHLVEIFAYAIFTVKIQIKINGKYVAGDKF